MADYSLNEQAAVLALFDYYRTPGASAPPDRTVSVAREIMKKSGFDDLIEGNKLNDQLSRYLKAGRRRRAGP